MSTGLLNIPITKDYSIADIENELSKLNNSITDVCLRLPRNHQKKLFKDSWITSLISTASNGRRLKITDWNTSDNETEMVDRLSNSMIGIVSTFVANEINNTQHHIFDIDKKSILSHISFDLQGLIEDSESGKSFVFCSFDSKDKELNFPVPLMLSVKSKDEFISEFLKFKRNNIDSLSRWDRLVYANASLISFPQAEKDLSGFVFELYQNTIKHGCKDENNELIEGVRLISIKRHYTWNSMISQATGFKELSDYLGTFSETNGMQFYEISISDNGMGIISRLLSTRPDLKNNEPFNTLDATSKLNKIISECLSSNDFPGSGQGLTLVLNNIKKLKGFLSLRTEDQWVYFSGKSLIETTDKKLINVQSVQNTPQIRGTHYNILIPINSTSTHSQVTNGVLPF